MFHAILATSGTYNGINMSYLLYKYSVTISQSEIDYISLRPILPVKYRIVLQRFQLTCPVRPLDLDPDLPALDPEAPNLVFDYPNIPRNADGLQDDQGRYTE